MSTAPATPTPRTATPSTPAPATAAGRFGDEYRELAKQRRFVRSAEAADSSLRAAAAAPAWQPASLGTRTPAPAPTAPARVAVRVPASGATPPATAATPAPRERIVVDKSALTEVVRMSQLLADARSDAAAQATMAAQLRGELAAAQQRLVAAKALVREAQTTTQSAAERAAWLEARCETLQEALEAAVHSTWLQRWRWRREQRSRSQLLVATEL